MSTLINFVRNQDTLKLILSLIVIVIVGTVIIVQSTSPNASQEPTSTQQAHTMQRFKSGTYKHAKAIGY